MNLYIFIVDSCRQNPTVLTLCSLCYVHAFLCTNHLLFISCTTPSLPYVEELAAIDTDTIPGVQSHMRESWGCQGHSKWWGGATGWLLSIALDFGSLHRINTGGSLSLLWKGQIYMMRTRKTKLSHQVQHLALMNAIFQPFLDQLKLSVKWLMKYFSTLLINISDIKMFCDNLHKPRSKGCV